MAKGGWGTRKVRFWTSVNARAAELFQRRVTAGVDYALTEVVRCKSTSEQGVAEAVGTCADLYLERTLAAAAAEVIVVLGVHARQMTRQYLVPTEAGSAVTSQVVGGKERLVVFAAHPTAYQPRRFERVLSPADLNRLRRRLETSGTPG